MTRALRFSHSELSNLLKYTFQGLYGHICDWGALADHVLWLETRGFNGVSLLNTAIEHKALRSSPSLVEDEVWGYRIDLQGGSVLTALPAISDLAMDFTLRNGTCRIDIVSGQQIAALASAQAELMRAGLSVECILSSPQLLCRADIKSARYRDKFGEAEAAYRKSLDDGISIDPVIYARLTEISERTLVEASEASRRGAGD